jgi:hypothetical protein
VEDGSEPIADDEFLYRRVPVSQGWFDQTCGLSSAAFLPHREWDQTGISVSRAKYKPIDIAARGQEGKSYYVAVLRAGDLRAHGISIVAQPLPTDPGHAELPDLNSGNRKSDATVERAQLLAETLCLRVEGPFPNPTPSP